jgi:hypothetical protein
VSALEAAGGTAARLIRLGAVDDPPSVSDITPGWIATVVIVTLCVATVLLWLSMRKQLGKIRFEEKDTPRRQRGRGPPVG